MAEAEGQEHPKQKGDTTASLLSVISSQQSSAESVKQFLTLINEIDKVTSTVERISFSNHLTHFKLIEVDNQMAEKFIQGSKLVFRGDRYGFASLCTADETYSVKEVETSNTMLLIESLGGGSEGGDKENLHIEEREVLGLAQHYLQLTFVPKPSSSKLRDLLRANELALNWNEQPEDSEKGATFEDLLDSVQMSEKQLEKALESMPVIRHNGKLRWLSNDLRSEILSRVIDYFDDPSTQESAEKFSPENIRSILSPNMPATAFEWFLSTMAEPVDSENGMYHIIDSSFVRARASQYLQTVARITVAAFEEAMNMMLPIGIALNYDYLRGICLIEESVTGKFISYLSSEDLPGDPRERLQILFDKKQQWKSEEISAFLADICTEQRAIDSLLLAQCRSFTDAQGNRIYCALRAV